jgi:hypothetical protein
MITILDSTIESIRGVVGLGLVYSPVVVCCSVELESTSGLHL